MNLSDTSSIVTISLGAITVAAWLWHLLSWLRKRLVQSEELASEGNRLAHYLLSHATTPTKRADIHLLMTLRTIEFKARQTESVVFSIGTGIFITILFLFSAFAGRFLDIDYSRPFVIFTILTFVGLVASFIMALWYSFDLRRLENGWVDGTLKAIEQKVEKHVPDA